MLYSIHTKLKIITKLKNEKDTNLRKKKKKKKPNNIYTCKIKTTKLKTKETKLG